MDRRGGGDYQILTVTEHVRCRQGVAKRFGYARRTKWLPFGC
ncbi:hypothetical protein WSK_0122 [Novosphingobium sp. Rr 2-17]|nr:hypothetical protein WSK_0122 [Novosphingobium sp. Rr 2-17]